MTRQPEIAKPSKPRPDYVFAALMLAAFVCAFLPVLRLL